MATSNSDGSVKINTDLDPSGFQKGLSKLGSLAKTGLSVAAKSITAISAGLVAIGGAIVTSYADYEQLIGGAELLFGNAFDFVEKRSQEAYKNVQMSQSEYLQQVNGFSTGLKTALGGNEQAAAELADRIITAEADIIAATGNSQEAVQNAFNGIMKSNFTMLDNLQLGITPTKEGFQEVIDKVNEWNRANGDATKYQISNLADCQSALLDYIEMQGMSGYAAEEAAKTISGSISMLKASFSNLAVGLGDADADVEMLCQNVIDAFGTLVSNVEPIAENIAAVLPEALTAGIGAIEVLLPDLLSSVGDLITGALPELADAAVALVGSLASGIVNNLDEISSAALEVVRILVDVLLDALPELPAIAGEIIAELGAGFAQYAPELISAAVNCVIAFTDGLIQQLPLILPVALQLVEGLVSGILTGAKTLLTGDTLAGLLDGIFAFLIDGIPQIISTVTMLVGQVAAALPEIIQNLLSPQLIESLISGIVSGSAQIIAACVQIVAYVVSHLPEIISGLIAAIPDIMQALYDGFVAAAPTFVSAGETIVEALQNGIEDIWNDAIVPFFSEAIPNLIDNIGEWFSELPGRVQEWLSETLIRVITWSSQMDFNAEEAGEQFIAAVISFLQQLPGKVWAWLQNTIAKVVSFATSFAQKAKQAGEDFLTNITSKVKEIPGKMLAIGKDIVTGVWNGISSASSWLYNKVAGFAKGIINGIKNTLGIHSPSRVMKATVGAMLPPGISEGFADALPAAERSMEKQLGSMTERLSGVSVPAIVSASMDANALEMMRAAVDLKTGQTAASVMADDPSGLPQKIGMLFEKFDALMSRMEALENDRLVSLSDLREALRGLRVEMDGRDVGEIIDERLGELYSMRENGVI